MTAGAGPSEKQPPAGSPAEEVTIRIDWTRCEGRGLCAELVPELISMDEWGYPVVAAGPVPPHLLGHVKRAASCCPVLALHAGRRR